MEKKLSKCKKFNYQTRFQHPIEIKRTIRHLNINKPFALLRHRNEIFKIELDHYDF